MARQGTAPLTLEGHLQILNEWDDPYELLLDGRDLVEVIIGHFGLGPKEGKTNDYEMLCDYAPFDFGKVRITIEQVR